MRLINDDTWQRIQLISITLEEIDVARVELLHRLENLAVRERAVSLERNMLQNLVAPPSNLPEEVLSMTFEAACVKQMIPVTLELSCRMLHGVGGTLLWELLDCGLTFDVTNPIYMTSCMRY